MIALVVGIVVVSILDDHGTTVTGLADTLVEIMDDGKFRFTNGWKKENNEVKIRIKPTRYIILLEKVGLLCIIGVPSLQGLLITRIVPEAL